ncbi:MAG TPA: LuxR C-terminal-related transcriptional regulator [Gemmataceae bacterium]|nr:LuxR C-terminal-related transcriptional regulator [Gemmataceae bacterium]
MGRSNRLSLREVRQAMRVVGECRDLGHDPPAWLRHAMGGLRQLLGANVVWGGLASADGFRLFSQLPLALCVGMDDAAQKAALEYLGGDRHRGDPAYRRYRRVARPNVTFRPLGVIARADYEKSEHHAFRRSLGMDDLVFSQRMAASRRATFALTPARAPGDPCFSPRHLQLLRLFHDELALLAGTVLSDGHADPLAGIQPRRRQALALLLSGDSEKAIALRMGISRHTAHEYVVALYRHFGVNSRAELMSLCHRRGIGIPNGALPGAPRGGGRPPV